MSGPRDGVMRMIHDDWTAFMISRIDLLTCLSTATWQSCEPLDRQQTITSALRFSSQAPSHTCFLHVLLIHSIIFEVKAVGHDKGKEGCIWRAAAREKLKHSIRALRYYPLPCQLLFLGPPRHQGNSRTNSRQGCLVCSVIGPMTPSLHSNSSAL